MILLHNVKKSYFSNNNTINALNNISLQIDKGDIFGVIGYSGAGKSTLIRCINLLEKPTSGKVFVNNIELTNLKEKELRKCREKIGMIFQHFNLMNNRNVFKNIAYPLKGKSLTKEDIKNKITNLLKLVGLEDKAFAYPSQLSGGQKQRVAIARALANEPEVLLCDEATSALDPQNTKSILNLLKEINNRLNLTIVIITHQMEVVKDICNKVAIMENGEIVEKGSIVDVFAKPKTKIAKDFIANTMHYDNIFQLLNSNKFIKDSSHEGITVKISFIGQSTGQAFISKISIDYKIYANILFGNIEILQGIPIGNLIVKFNGIEEKIFKALEYLKENNINVEVLDYDKISKFNNSQCGGPIS
ncbi:D-methionine transport system ATP-binding protein [Clostridium tetanomorphum]|uniref:ATP-binding cassette domain-containing protein n=1 Tax=Clostridium tetanomorphum TaxID=1553 RepID=A0A923E889_CLOTT|nr:ATP-binding cassette domain-containing protein [Clostridium tetanomorphum]KAJ53090.1 ABC transporter-like protein [Clostridium tetanomorphum DSM 665]MBC2398372.1 ATP-binding cassette domain-containing protein [Clostridium tetanomorphum]MBP1865525.1 D-methionine transport system ATP-binding protein [Clostridium tetanomorphum]NRS86471.1 D-methionine transport system ATP-binding protein [Clostridium tetanomorphum]NRZ95500.1 D-methionine transport system ATP-binding protein [Clostridium tetanom